MMSENATQSGMGQLIKKVNSTDKIIGQRWKPSPKKRDWQYD